MPLNNRRWLKQRFAAIRKLPTEADREKAVREIVDWTNPGPGGFYDDLGNLAQQPHLVVGEGFDRDPAFLRFGPQSALPAPSCRTMQTTTIPPPGGCRGSIMPNRCCESPLTMHYTDLDRDAQYKLRVVYGGDGPQKKIRLIAGDGYRNPSVPDEAFSGRANRVRHSGRGHAHRRIDAPLESRAGLGRQRPRLPGVRGLAD